jgi:trimethylamine--corrinoid protein Co-methyltransferase
MSKATMSVLAKDEIELVHETSLRILSEVGIKIESPYVLDLLKKAGARIDTQKELAFMGEEIISRALKSAPRNIRLCSRRGVDYEIPGNDVQMISPDGQPPAVFDIDTGKKRLSVLRDVKNFAIVCDALPEVDFVWPPVVANDVPEDMIEESSFYEFLMTMAYTSKHVQHGATSAKEASFQIEVATAIAGSPSELRKRPLFSDVCTPISPLRYDKGEAEALVNLSRAGIPMVHLSMGIAGSVTPVTISGTLAVTHAENLCGLALTQAASPGAPSIYSSFSGVADLKSGVFLCGTPEGNLMDAASIEMARHFGLPTCCGGPSNSARTLSAEAGLQTAMSAMSSVMTGADLMVGLGGLDRAGMMSLEKVVMDCEIWRWLRRMRKGISVNQETLGFDAIKRQGPGGAFLSDPHTLRHMRKCLMIPQITGHHASGIPDYSVDDLIEYSKRKTKEILKTYEPPLLSKDIADKVGKVAKRYGVLHRNGDQIFDHA